MMLMLGRVDVYARTRARAVSVWGRVSAGCAGGAHASTAPLLRRNMLCCCKGKEVQSDGRVCRTRSAAHTCLCLPVAPCASAMSTNGRPASIVGAAPPSSDSESSDSDDSLDRKQPPSHSRRRSRSPAQPSRDPNTHRSHHRDRDNRSYRDYRDYRDDRASRDLRPYRDERESSYRHSAREDYRMDYRRPDSRREWEGEYARYSRGQSPPRRSRPAYDDYDDYDRRRSPDYHGPRRRHSRSPPPRSHYSPSPKRRPEAHGRRYPSPPRNL